MERQQCKLCSRVFANGRALGGHMKAHMAVLPLPPKPHQPVLAESTHFASTSEDDEDEQQKSHDAEEEEDEEDHKGLVYGLRENPKKSFRLADPEFTFAVDAGSVVIQDRESETESRNPTRRRSKRNRRTSFTGKLEVKKPKLTSSTTAEPEQPALSSVSDTSPEEDVAKCLMMLSRDAWMRRTNVVEEDQEQNDNKNKEAAVVKNESVDLEENEIKSKKVRGGKNRCDKCSKLFRSHPAMCVHKKICFRSEAEANNAASSGGSALFKCPFCSKIFGSGQALGGHKRSHLNSRTTVTVTKVVKEFRESFIDLNMPAPLEEDDFSVVSDA